jgi:hypothetical protein
LRDKFQAGQGDRHHYFLLFHLLHLYYPIIYLLLLLKLPLD